MYTHYPHCMVVAIKIKNCGTVEDLLVVTSKITNGKFMIRDHCVFIPALLFLKCLTHCKYFHKTKLKQTNTLCYIEL